MVHEIVLRVQFEQGVLLFRAASEFHASCVLPFGCTWSQVAAMICVISVGASCWKITMWYDNHDLLPKFATLRYENEVRPAIWAPTRRKKFRDEIFVPDKTPGSAPRIVVLAFFLGPLTFLGPLWSHPHVIFPSSLGKSVGLRGS